MQSAAGADCCGSTNSPNSRFILQHTIIFCMDRKLAAQLVVLFLITQALGLYVGMSLIAADVHATIITENPEDIGNSIALFAYILVFTAILLVVVAYLKRYIYLIFKALETLAVFATSLIVFAALGSFLPLPQALVWAMDLVVLVAALAVVILRIIYAKHIWLRNVSSVIAVAGAGALIGVSLGVLPVLVFLVLLAVYDFIAVFKTKHMVTLAKSLTKKNLSFTYAMPTPKHTFELGTGDMVIPLAFAVSVLSAYAPLYAFPMNLVPSVAILGAALAGQLATIEYSSRHVGKALPALPPQVIAMLVAFGLMKLFGF